jgi:two-component system, NtrC family, nitrogen regulation sensor histidine kinase NtrY
VIVTPRAAPRTEVTIHLWTLVAGVALVAGGWWLRTPSVGYLAFTVAATVATLGIALLWGRGARRWAVACALALAAFAVVATSSQRDLTRIDTNWPAYRAGVVERGRAEFQRAIARALSELQTKATRALDAPTDASAAFASFRGLTSGAPEQGIVLYDRGVPFAWGGRLVIPPDSARGAIGALHTPFYTVLYAAATRGGRRAVATAVAYAEPPGDQLVPAIGNRIASEQGLHAFGVMAPGSGASADGFAVLSPNGRDTLLVAHTVAPGAEEARLTSLVRVRLTGAIFLAFAFACFLVALWRRQRSLLGRLVPLAVALGLLALMPLNTFSGSGVLFDPTVYYAEVGGPFTASVGALGAAATIVLLALLLRLRRGLRLSRRWMAVPIVVSLLAASPPLLRALGAGVAPPPGGVSVQLWLGWEIALFLVAATLFILVAAIGSAGLGPRRFFPPWLAPALAIVAAAIAPAVMLAPGAWPTWYRVLWMVVVATLALTTSHRRIVLVAGSVAALVATTLTWGAGVRGRATLADRDVAALAIVDPDIVSVLQRLGADLRISPVARSEAELAKRYMRSDLVGSGYPVDLMSWTPEGLPTAEVTLDQLTPPVRSVGEVAANARASGSTQLQSVLGVPGVFVVLAVPHPDSSVTTVVVAPRTRLIATDPFAPLLGLEDRETGEPPYSVALVERQPGDSLLPGGTRWYRDANEMHGDHVVLTSQGPMRAHIEIDLRSLGVLLQRGALAVMLDLVLLFALWMIAALPDGRVLKRVRVGVRRWGTSYRSRLTVVLFAFFVIPALAFALWSYERLRSEDRQSRDLVLREALRGISTDEEARRGASLVGHTDLPLLLYRNGELSGASQPLFDALAPMGAYLPPSAYASLADGREVYASLVEEVAGGPALFGFRVSMSGSGERYVIGAPARGTEAMLDQRRRDLAVLVACATVLGALAALALSQAASRSLAEPIGALRVAALAIARGEREPPLAARAPDEFQPVFSAFRRMAADLGESRAALESAQRRTAAILRNVASGVVALDADDVITLANPRAEMMLDRPLPPGLTAEGLGKETARRLRAFAEGAMEEEEFELTVHGRQLQARLTRLAAGRGGTVLTLDDITELARAQRVLAWGEMARQVAHEIKNPLTPIRLGVQHLKRAHADKRADFDTILDSNAERILAEIDRLDEIARGFSRYGMGPSELQTAEPVNVSAIVRDVVELEKLGEGSVEWRTAGIGNAVMAYAREDELREVMLNLLENSRFAGATWVEVRVDGGGERVAMAVRDDGGGIPASVQARLFEPHFSTRTRGSGLGLAISRRLVESWGGEIAVASVEGEGTTVRIVLRGGPAGLSSSA